MRGMWPQRNERRCLCSLDMVTLLCCFRCSASSLRPGDEANIARATVLLNPCKTESSSAAATFRPDSSMSRAFNGLDILARDAREDHGGGM